MDLLRLPLWRLALVSFLHQSVYLKVLLAVQPSIRIRVCLHFFSLIQQLIVFSSDFVSPAAVRVAIRHEKGEKYRVRKEAEMEREERREEQKLPEDELAVRKVFA